MSVLQKLVKYGEAALRPTLVNGKWKRPMISRRQAAVVRKTALIEGTFGSVDPVKGMFFKYRVHIKELYSIIIAILFSFSVEIAVELLIDDDDGKSGLLHFEPNL